MLFYRTRNAPTISAPKRGRYEMIFSKGEQTTLNFSRVFQDTIEELKINWFNSFF